MEVDDVNSMNVSELKDFLKHYGVGTSGYRKDKLQELATFVSEHNLEPVLTAGGRMEPLALEIMIEKKLKGFKSFEDYRLFADGHVLNLLYHKVSDASPHCLFRAQVKPTQRDVTYLKKHSYDLCFLLEKASGEIKAAYCQCPGGADGACRHIAAALYALESWEKTSVTDGPCQWQRRPMAHDRPVPINRLCIQDVKYGSEIHHEVIDFDPRHPDDRAPLSHEEQQDFVKSLYEIVPSASAVSLHLAPGTIEDSEDLKPNQDCVSLSVVKKAALFTEQNSESLKEDNCWPEELCSKFVSSLVYTDEEIQFINKETVGQHENPTWHAIRAGIITASNSDRISSRVNTIIEDPTTDPSKAVDTVLGTGPKIPEDIASLKWGKTKENLARRLYLRVQRKLHRRMKIKVPGLRVYAKKPFLGCSVDGIATCNCIGHTTKLIEIKCPYTLRLKSPKEAAKAKGCEFIDNAWQISKKSVYYSQIQGQLGIYGLETCDLVIYTTQGIQVVPVSFDALHFQEMVLRFEFFYTYCVIPTMFSRFPVSK